MTLKSDETVLPGQWKRVDGKMIEDETSKRIRTLIREHLEAIATTGGGWEKLFRDPADGRLWELTYSTGDTHGGGPPTLKLISEESAHNKYSF